MNQGTHWITLYSNDNNKSWRVWINRNAWIALYFTDNNVTYFGSLGVEHIPKETEKFIKNKRVIANIYRIPAYDSIMCGYFCIGFIDFMLEGKSLLDYANLFSSNDYEKNDKIILKYFQ